MTTQDDPRRGATVQRLVRMVFGQQPDRLVAAAAVALVDAPAEAIDPPLKVRYSSGALRVGAATCTKVKRPTHCGYFEHALDRIQALQDALFV